MSHVIRLKDEQGNWIPVPTIKGDAGRGIVSIARTSGTGAPGTVDTYTITYTDGTTDTFQIRNGSDGMGAGDMTKAVYDANGNGIVDNAEKLGGELPAYYAVAASVVPNIRTINNKALSADISLSASDVGADASGAASSAVSTHNSASDAHSSLFAAKQDSISISGLLKGTGTAVSAAVAGTDYQAPLTAGTDYATPAAVALKQTAPTQLTALPASGTALTDNAEYRPSAAVGTYAFAWPTSPFECWLKFTTDATFAITFPSGTTYIGGAPTFAASKTYEMSVKDGVVIVQEVTAS